jgi:hypothetical protein
MSKYWNQQGRYQTEQMELTKLLVPATGPAPTVAGEILRAANRLYYDGSNNGFANNCSGEVAYLYAHLLPYCEQVRDALNYIAPMANCGGFGSISERASEALDTIIDCAVEAITAYPALTKRANCTDLRYLAAESYVEADYLDEYA